MNTTTGMNQGNIAHLLTPTTPRETPFHPGGSTPYDLVTAAGEECKKGRHAEARGYGNVAAVCYREAERLLSEADIMRGLDREPGYQPCRLNAAATASPNA